MRTSWQILGIDILMGCKGESGVSVKMWMCHTSQLKHHSFTFFIVFFNNLILIHSFYRSFKAVRTRGAARGDDQADPK